MELNDKELLRLLKHGRAEELAELAEEMKPTYADSFPAFMDQMLKEHHLKRSTVARRSGLSQDYLYKLLRGDKRTTERDYIIANLHGGWAEHCPNSACTTHLRHAVIGSKGST